MTPGKKRRNAPHAAGFTLLEVIVTIIIAAILGSIAISFTGTALRGSAEALASSTDLARAHSVMENITSRHRFLFVSQADPLLQLSQEIGAEGSNRNNGFGTYAVVHNRRIWFNTTTHAENNANPQNLLKVTVRVGSARVTCLFGQ